MNKVIQDHFQETLKHLYINPLEKCNLRCKICYTKKTSAILKEKQILNFIESYKKVIDLRVITFCGGEVFTLPYMIQFINELNHKGLFLQIITNGTIDRLSEINNPNSVNLIISLDGLEKYHDKNRGKGNFQKSVAFIKKAIFLGFHVEIFSIVTKQNLNDITQFELFIKNELNNIPITYHPRKSLSYLNKHPQSNIIGETTGFDFLSPDKIIRLMKTKQTFPSQKLGCYQISLMSDGKIYGCCEGFQQIGTINDSINQLIDRLKQNIRGPCLGCSESDFMCGIKDIISKLKS